MAQIPSLNQAAVKTAVLPSHPASVGTLSGGSIEALREEKRETRTRDANAAASKEEALTSEQLTRPDLSKAALASKALKLTEKEQQTFKTVLQVLLPEIQPHEAGFQSLGTSAPGTSSETPTDLPADHYVSKDAPTAETTQTGTHQGQATQDSTSALRDGKPLYDRDSKSHLEQTLAKHLTTPQAQKKFAQALGRIPPDAQYIVQALKNMPLKEKGPAHAEIAALLKCLSRAEKHPLSPEGRALVNKTHQQALLLGRILSPQSKAELEAFVKGFQPEGKGGQAVVGTKNEGIKERVKIVTNTTEAKPGDETYANSIASPKDLKKLLLSGSNPAAKPTESEGLKQQSTVLVAGGHGREEDTPGDDANNPDRRSRGLFLTPDQIGTGQKFSPGRFLAAYRNPRV